MNYFAIEDAMVARLSSISGLVVQTTTDVSDTALKAVAKPTAVVVFTGDETTDSNDYAVQLEQNWSVYLICRGPRKDRTTDGVLLHQIVSRLHGWQPLPEAHPFKLLGVESDYVDNAREYLASFSTRTVIQAAP